MSSDEERRNDARQIRVFTIAACIFLAAAIAFVVLELTTDLNGEWRDYLPDVVRRECRNRSRAAATAASRRRMTLRS